MGLWTTGYDPFELLSYSYDGGWLKSEQERKLLFWRRSWIIDRDVAYNHAWYGVEFQARLDDRKSFGLVILVKPAGLKNIACTYFPILRILGI